MLDTAIAQLRLVASIILDKPFAMWSLEWLINSIRDTRHEFGILSSEAAEFLKGPTLDAKTRGEFHLRRFQRQATRAAWETSYYGRLFEQIALNPEQLRYEDISHIPVTTKRELRTQANAFVSRIAQPALGVMTANWSDQSARVYFSEYELRLMVALMAIELLLKDEAGADDIVQSCYPASATLLNLIFGRAYTRLGAIVHLVGQVEPTSALALLTQNQHLAGKKPCPSILLAYPSYLSKLVEHGLQLGYQPHHFSLERIVTTGEIVTEGLKSRCQLLFGPVQFTENYATVATLPLWGASYSEGILQFEPLPGLTEVINPETGAPAQPGEVGTIVITPFSSYRDTTLLLRYDTEDMVRILKEQPGYGITSHILGKLNFSVKKEHGWIFPRDVQETLEAIEEVPLPARYGFWDVPGGVAVEVLIRKNLSSVRGKVEQSLIERGIPVCELYLVETSDQLQHPIPLRCDLSEPSLTLPNSSMFSSLLGQAANGKSNPLSEEVTSNLEQV